MLTSARQVQAALQKLASPTKAVSSAWYFQTQPGGYGAGDIFIGVTVPDQRRVAREACGLVVTEMKELLTSPIHEHRLTALFVLVDAYQRADQATKKQLASFYHTQRRWVNNWDLVDSSAPYILGDYLFDHSRNILVHLARSRSVWDRRIAMLTTQGFIRRGDYTTTLKLAALLMHDPHDLMHKAVGWMLREVGNRSESTLRIFLDQHAPTMPRTMLRYAIEKLSSSLRTYYRSLRKTKG